jgi:hypothetical protein
MTAFLVLISLCAGREEVLPSPLETPPFRYTLESPAGMERAVYIPDLVLLESASNAGIDFGEWFVGVEDWPAVTYHNGGVNDEIRGTVPPTGIARVLYTPGDGEFHLYQFIFGHVADFAMYGDPPNRYGVVLNPRILEVFLDPVDPEPSLVLDFLGYGHSPADTFVNPSATFQQLQWAEVSDDSILYVSNAHRTYAESSGGLNAYMTAIDLKTLEVRWRSEPLVANAENFLLLDDAIITGYGFTAEDDFIYVLDRLTGEVMQSIPVPSAPQYLYAEGDRLHVRCYDTDLVFSIR